MDAREHAGEERARPRVLELDLASLGSEPRLLLPRPWSAPDPALERVGALSGGPLAAALALERVRAGRRPPFVLAVGLGVVRGVPTAARATIAGRAPASGRWAEGQVGSELGRRLARLADALLLEGRAPGAEDLPSVLILERGEDGRARVELVGRPELARLGPDELARRLRLELGPCSILRVGPAARRGLTFANLAAGGEEGEAASYVGRGGLGASFGALGLAALVLRCEPVGGSESEARELARMLASSPRLVARGEGGTLELAGAEALEGARDFARAEAWGASLRARRGARQGCAGCPTPCGWVFATPAAAAPRGARFGALDALGPALGLARAEECLHVLAACDEEGLDAKEVGALLSLWSRAQERGLLAGEPAFGRAAELARRVHLLARSDEPAASVLAAGAERAGRALGLGHEPLARRDAPAGSTDVAARLAERSRARGQDPMRTFAFLLGAGADPARIARLLPGSPVGSADPTRPDGKGLLLAWHEAFVAAVDATGFCAFSAAGLLADGTLELDELAARITPPEWSAWIEGAAGASPGRVLLAGGASALALARELDHALGVAPAVLEPEPALRSEELCLRLARGLGEDGRPTPATLARLGTLQVLEPLLPDVAAEAVRRPPPAEPRAPAAARRVGTLHLEASGPLAERLGDGRVTLPLPATVLEVLRAAEERHPRAAGWLLRGGAPVPAVFRAGARLLGGDPAEEGERLVLVLAIRGGAP